MPFPEVSADYSSSSEDECETTKERHTKKRIKDLARKAATQAITAAIALKTPLVVIAEEKDEATAESIRTLFKDAETSPEKTPQEVADELGAERDKLAEQVLKKRTTKKAKIAEIYQAESYDLYYLPVVTTEEVKDAKANHDKAKKVFTKIKTISGADEADVQKYQDLFRAAQAKLEDKEAKHKSYTKKQKEIEQLKIELANIITAKTGLIAQRNKIADKRKAHVAKHSIPSASYFWSLGGYRSDDELVNSDTEEIAAGAALPATEEEFRPLQGCLTQNEALALTDK